MTLLELAKCKHTTFEQGFVCVGNMPEKIVTVPPYPSVVDIFFKTGHDNRAWQLENAKQAQQAAKLLKMAILIGSAINQADPAYGLVRFVMKAIEDMKAISPEAIFELQNELNKCL